MKPKPEDFLDPSNFPEDLNWVPGHYKIHPDDPVYLLIAWHWKRVKASEDTLKATVVELKSALDSRLQTMKESADAITAIGATLTAVQQSLATKPELLGKQLDQQLSQPIAAAVKGLGDLERNLAPVAKIFVVARRRQTLATLLIGLILGVLGALILFHP
jgi:hypothetical protein